MKSSNLHQNTQKKLTITITIYLKPIVRADLEIIFNSNEKNHLNFLVFQNTCNPK